ncbi:hypothetical protein KM043_000886 [Ampulex compressa]|nr:hypothetical protein KM043_000886 [Ampulex compressa]
MRRRAGKGAGSGSRTRSRKFVEKGPALARSESSGVAGYAKTVRDWWRTPEIVTSVDIGPRRGETGFSGRPPLRSSKKRCAIDRQEDSAEPLEGAMPRGSEASERYGQPRASERVGRLFREPRLISWILFYRGSGRP